MAAVSDRASVEDIVSSMSPVAQEALRQVLLLEREHLHIRSVERLPDEIVKIVKGLIK